MGRVRQAWSSTANRAALGVVLVLATLTALSVNTFPAVTSDSVHYLGHSFNFGEEGLVELGFRNVGYPVFIWLVRSGASLFGAEPLLAVAVAQRVLLLGLVVYAWWLWRWFALPLTVVLVAPEVLAFTNFLLIEAVALGLAMLLAIAVYQCLRPDTTTALERGDSKRWITWFIVSCVVTAVLFSMKFTFAGFLAVPVIIALASWRHAVRKTIVVTLAIWAVLVGGFALGLSFENLEEQGTFSPSFDANNAAYYYAWVLVNGDAEGAPPGHLAPLRLFSDATTPELIGPEAALEVRHAAVVELLDGAGIGYRSSQLESALWGLTGGRFHETANAVAWMMTSTRTNVDEIIHMNRFSIQEGHQAFRDMFNDGRVPGAVLTDSIGIDVFPDGRALVKWLLPASLLVSLIGMFFTRTRWLAVAAFIPMVAQAFGLGLVRADTFRYLLPAAIYTIATATAVAFVWFSSRAPTDSEEVSVPVATPETVELTPG